jgi:hypothetical protein
VRAARVSGLEQRGRWLALDIDGRTWPVIAAWLFGAQVLLYLVSRVVDALWFPVTSYGLFAAMLLFAGYILVDALQVGYSFWRAYSRVRFEAVGGRGRLDYRPFPRLGEHVRHGSLPRRSGSPAEWQH